MTFHRQLILENTSAIFNRTGIFVEGEKDIRHQNSFFFFFFPSKKYISVFTSKMGTKWNKNELIWICANIENGNYVLDPYNFILQDYAYLVHIKNCFSIENNL